MGAFLPGSGRVSNSGRDRQTIGRVVGVVAAFFYLHSGFVDHDWSMWAVLLIALFFLWLGFSKPVDFSKYDENGRLRKP